MCVCGMEFSEYIVIHLIDRLERKKRGQNNCDLTSILPKNEVIFIKVCKVEQNKKNTLRLRKLDPKKNEKFPLPINSYRTVIKKNSRASSIEIVNKTLAHKKKKFSSSLTLSVACMYQQKRVVLRA